MGYSLVFTAKAIQDLDCIVAYIARDNPVAACRFEQKLLNKVSLLLVSPEIGVAVKRRVKTRYIVCRPYLIFYCINQISNTIEVLRFWHGARNKEGMTF